MNPPSTDILKRLETLEPLSRRLEPGADERAELARQVFEHAERAIARYERGPAYRPPVPNDASWLEEAPIGEDPIGFERALDLHDRHVDGPKARDRANLPHGGAILMR